MLFTLFAPSTATATLLAVIVPRAATLLMSLTLASSPHSHAEQTPTFVDAFNAARELQPIAILRRSLTSAAELAQRDANRLLAAPATITGRFNDDRYSSDVGEREWETTIWLPIMPPAERKARRASASAMAQLAESQSAVASLESAGHLREIFWRLQKAKVVTESARATLEQLRDALALLELAIETGDRPASDRLFLDSEIALAAGEVAAAEQQKVPLWHHWIELTGLEVLPPALAEATSSIPVEQQIAQHPLLVAQRQALTEAKAETKLQQTRWTSTPAVGLGIRDQRANAQTPGIRSLSLNFELPLDFGQFNQRARAAAQSEQARLTYRVSTLQRTLIHEAVQAGSVLRQAQQKSLLMQQVSEQRDAIAQLMQTRFQHGDATINEWLQAKRDAQAARTELATARIEAAAATAALNQATGRLPQ